MAYSIGNVYIADNYRIRKVTLDGNINTIAGGGSGASVSEENGNNAILANLSGLRGVDVDSTGNIYIAHDNYIRIIS